MHNVLGFLKHLAEAFNASAAVLFNEMTNGGLDLVYDLRSLGPSSIES